MRERERRWKKLRGRWPIGLVVSSFLTGVQDMYVANDWRIFFLFEDLQVTQERRLR